MLNESGEDESLCFAPGSRANGFNSSYKCDVAWGLIRCFPFFVPLVGCYKKSLSIYRLLNKSFLNAALIMLH